LKLDRHNPAFVSTCDIEYLKYLSICKRFSCFDFGKADVDGMILQLSAVDWSDLLGGDCVDERVRKFYYRIYECFELFVLKYIVKDCTVKYPWFDRELHNVDNNKMKAHKYLKEF
jgi:hypothetical protein